MSGHSGTFEDDRQYLRDELLIQSDEWIKDLFFTAEQKQAQEIRRTLGHLIRLRSMVELSRKETRKVDEAIATLRLHLVAMRIK
jgi:hypothetical protein